MRRSCVVLLRARRPHLIGEGAQQVLDNHHVFTDAVLVEQQALTQPHVRRQVELEIGVAIRGTRLPKS